MACLSFSAASARATAACSRGETGCENGTCPTQPVPKKLFSRAKVRSMNWSTRTNVPGGNSSFSEPTADKETRSVTPARFIASMFAR